MWLGCRRNWEERSQQKIYETNDVGEKWEGWETANFQVEAKNVHVPLLYVLTVRSSVRSSIVATIVCTIWYDVRWGLAHGWKHYYPIP